MKLVVTTAVIFLFFAAFNCQLYPQKVNLVELQKKEKERRKNTKKSKYVITNDNIDKIDVPKKPHSFIKMESSKKGDKNRISTADKSQVPPGQDNGSLPIEKNKGYWVQTKIDLLKRISSSKSKLDEMQSEFSQAKIDYPDETLDQQIRRKQGADKLLEKINEEKQQLAKLEKELSELEIKARKLGVPPGWLRVDLNDLESRTTKEKKTTKTIINNNTQ